MAKRAKTAFTFERQTILKAALFNLEQVKQWADMGLYGNAAKYSAKAEACIELLEVADCGSTGGFDVGQDREKNWTLEMRYRWLKEKR